MPDRAPVIFRGSHGIFRSGYKAFFPADYTGKYEPLRVHRLRANIPAAAVDARRAERISSEAKTLIQADRPYRSQHVDQSSRR